MENEQFDNRELELEIRELGTPNNVVGIDNLVVLVDEYDRRLNIRIGPCETMAILRKLQQDTDFSKLSVQPFAHDLLLAICQSLDAEVEKIVIDDLWKDTYYAKLHLLRNGEQIVIDTRPSDAIALALRANCPIFATDAVMTTAERHAREADEEG
jgi:uncharacterized protein